MPLSNRAPTDATGKLMVTTITPAPGWPVLGGMTYHPTTGELAVIDAVPAAGDPWVGGIRFTNLGSMYVTSTLPSPIFYVGGLPVSTDGRLFMSSNPPIGSVGGWPVAGDGGISGVGLSPQPMFFAPLMTTLVPTTAGNPTFTFSRAALAYAMDFEGILRQSIANEARFQGARRVRNWLTGHSQDCTNGAWTKTNATPSYGATGPTGLPNATTLTSTNVNGTAYQLPTGAVGMTAVTSYWIRRRTGTGAIRLIDANSAQIDLTAQIDGTWRRLSLPPVVVSGTAALGVVLGVSGDAVDVTYMQFEAVQGQSNQAPSEYVSVGVLTPPYHGAGVDGVKFFNYLNPNVVE